MRPKIPESLEQKVNNQYKERGYATPTEMVRDAVRQFTNNPPTATRLPSTPDNPAHVTLGRNLDDGDPVTINWFNSPTPNTLTVGPIGAGKTYTATGHLLRLDATIDDLDVITVDVLGDGPNLTPPNEATTIQIGPDEYPSPLHTEDGAKYTGEPLPRVALHGTRQFLKSYLTEFIEADLQGVPRFVTGATYRFLREDTYQDADDFVDCLMTHLKEADAANYGPAVEPTADLARKIAPLLTLFSGTAPTLSAAPFSPADVEFPLRISPQYVDVGNAPVGDEKLPARHQLFLALLRAYAFAQRNPNTTIVVVDNASLLLKDPDLLFGVEQVLRDVETTTVGIHLLTQSLPDVDGIESFLDSFEYQFLYPSDPDTFDSLQSLFELPVGLKRHFRGRNVAPQTGGARFVANKRGTTDWAPIETTFHSAEQERIDQILNADD